MPLIEPSGFRPARGLENGHLQTIWPTLFRRVPLITHERKRLELEDNDFLDLDWARHDVSQKLVIITHGLESNSRDTTVQGMAGAFFANGWDVLAWNMRGCSGEPNRLPRFYHSGATEDLSAVVDHAIAAYRYQKVALVGFSLGGNLTLKYLAETRREPVIAAVTFSVPCNLQSSVERLDRAENQVYTRRFIRSLRAKILTKKLLFPDHFDVTRLEKMRTFREFDSAYTAPLHGFSSAEDYWQQSSCGPLLGDIRIPTLLVNARNDPFLTPPCFPESTAASSDFLHLEIPESGGHCGFVSSATETTRWHELRAVRFVDEKSDSS